MTADGDGDLDVRLYSVAKVAELWGTGTTFVYDEINAGRLPTVQLGNGDRNKIRILARDVKAWIRDRRTTAQQ